jgi:hypothetical protein
LIGPGLYDVELTHRIGLEGSLLAPEGRLRLLELGLLSSQLGFRLVELGLVGPGVDHEEEFPALDPGTRLKSDALQIPFNSCPDLHRFDGIRRPGELRVLRGSN